MIRSTICRGSHVRIIETAGDKVKDVTMMAQNKLENADSGAECERKMIEEESEMTSEFRAEGEGRVVEKKEASERQAAEKRRRTEEQLRDVGVAHGESFYGKKQRLLREYAAAKMASAEADARCEAVRKSRGGGYQPRG